MKHHHAIIAALAFACALFPSAARAQNQTWGAPGNWECADKGVVLIDACDPLRPLIDRRLDRLAPGWWHLTAHGRPGGVIENPAGPRLLAGPQLDLLCRDPLFQSSKHKLLLTCSGGLPGEEICPTVSLHSSRPQALPSHVELAAQRCPGTWVYGAVGETRPHNLSVIYAGTSATVQAEALANGKIKPNGYGCFDVTPDTRGAWVGIQYVVDGFDKDGNPVLRPIGIPYSQKQMLAMTEQNQGLPACYAVPPRRLPFMLRNHGGAVDAGGNMFAFGAAACDQYGRAYDSALRIPDDPSYAFQSSLHGGAGVLATGGTAAAGSTALYTFSGGTSVTATRIGALACRTPQTAACVVTAGAGYYLGHTISTETFVGDALAACIAFNGELYTGNWDFSTTQCLLGMNPNAKPIRTSLRGCPSTRGGGAVQLPNVDPPYAEAPLAAGLSSGCACSLHETGGRSQWMAALALLALIAVRRRRGV